MDSTIVERSIWIDAPRERVWSAITEPAQLEQWFMPQGLGMQLKRGTDGKLSVLMGPMAVDLAVLEGENPPREVTSRGLPDGVIATTYTLDEENSGTRVTVRMSGFEALPENARRDRLEPSGAAWDKALTNLKAYIAGGDLPHPEGFVAALFGFRRETPQKIAVERSIWIAAPIDRVWNAITDPAMIEQWFSPGTQWRGTGLKVGGTFSVYDAATDTDMYTQVIDVIDAPHRFVTRSTPEPPEKPHVSEWTLVEENGGTRLTITESGYEHEPVDARYMGLEQNAFGFGMMLQNLKASVEGEALPFPGGF